MLAVDSHMHVKWKKEFTCPAWTRKCGTFLRWSPWSYIILPSSLSWTTFPLQQHLRSFKQQLCYLFLPQSVTRQQQLSVAKISLSKFNPNELPYVLCWQTHTASHDGGPAVEGGGWRGADGFKKVQGPRQRDSDFPTSSAYRSSNGSRFQTPVSSVSTAILDRMSFGAGNKLGGEHSGEA